MNGAQTNANALVISYLTLRKAIGVLGTSFPFLLFLGALLIFRTGIQESISYYYHTGMQDVFVGILFAMGFFLLSYKGYETPDGERDAGPRPWIPDNVAGNLACVFAVGVALFPTTPDNASAQEEIIGVVHFVFAGSFFLTLVYFSLCLFTRTDPTRERTPRKRQRDKVYRAAGITMLACLGLIIAYYALGFLLPAARQLIAPYRPVLWLEAITIVAFGISWLTKGEAILSDEA